MTLGEAHRLLQLERNSDAGFRESTILRRTSRLGVDWQVASRPGQLETATGARELLRRATHPIRAKVEHPFLYVNTLGTPRSFTGGC